MEEGKGIRGGSGNLYSVNEFRFFTCYQTIIIIIIVATYQIQSP